jgi:hypothetical protein
MWTTHHPEHQQRQTFDPVSRFSAVRDLAIVAVCVAIVAGFLAQVWNLPRTPGVTRGSERAAWLVLRA